jgi:phosphoribosyl 1,2-cyclic phosphate phosphodiesterase
MNFEQCLQIKNEMLDSKSADEHTRFIVTHFSHNGAKTHEETQEIAEQEEMTVAYDGVEYRL